MQSIECGSMSIWTQRFYGRVAFLVTSFLLFAAGPAFAQAGGEVVDVKVLHVVSSIGAPTPPDEIQLRLRVVDERGHAFTQVFTNNKADVLFDPLSRLREPSTPPLVLLNESDANRWLAGGEERRRLLIDLYISMFQRLDEDVARGRIASTNARIDRQKAQGYVTLADIAAAVKARAQAAAKPAAAEKTAAGEAATEKAAVESMTDKCKRENSQTQVIHRVEPEYTVEARKAGYQGTVTLEIIVEKDGSVTFNKIVRILGFGLDEKAIAAIKQWKFAPVSEECRVRRALPVQINFHLK